MRDNVLALIISEKVLVVQIWLLYPINDEMRGHDEIKFESGDGTIVRLHFVDVEHIADNLIELSEKIEMI